MAERSLIERERAALHDLLALCAERARTEADLTARYAARKAALEKASQQERAAIERRYESARESAEKDLLEARTTLPAQTEALTAEAQANHDAAKKKILQRFQRDSQQIGEALDQARWESMSVFEAGQSAAADARKQMEARLDHEHALAESLAARMDDFLIRSHMRSVAARPAPAAAEHGEVPPDPLDALRESNARADEALLEVEQLVLPRLLRGGLPFLLYLAFAVAGGIIGAMIAGPPVAIGAAAGASVVLGTACWLGLYRVARRQVARLYPRFSQAIDRSDWLLEHAEKSIEVLDQARRAELQEKNQHERRAAERKAATERQEIEAWRDIELSQIAARLAHVTADVRQRNERALQTAEATAARLLAENEQLRADELDQFQKQDDARRRQYAEDSKRDWDALIERWNHGLERWHEETHAIHEESRRLFLDWTVPGPIWSPPDRVAPALRFGQFTVEREKLPSGAPRDPRLRNDLARVTELPALTPFPEVGGSLLIRAWGDGRAAGVALLQAAMLRMLTSIPPGKLRFTIVDPVGLGQNFAAFMHLADHDEALVTSRIWTEAPHIEKKLAELTEHMEKVIQKYLRNEYSSIQEYNEVAGEVAEPFRVLVVANFPTNFTEQAARRLISIAQSGPRCGVFTLVSVDEREPLPTGCTIPDIEVNSTILAWREGRFVWKDLDFGGFPLALDQPPPDETLTRLVQQAGEAAKDANRVEVPFDIVAPDPSRYWTESTSEGIDLPLGRVGATKFQSLRLGRGTSQHVLIAGRTGSGKSTLLHALITNAALRYSPDEVELYLIDFKKGVEFKTYAAHQLPHARVVAIESEREFGLSVLQRLDEEMRRRGELFRDMNVQDVAGFREAKPDRPMPRVLLIVDEFQEFFVEDDKLAQEAALLLDRLVRQGRAFGIHVLLGSQTLGGAFSLARSTIGQMAVRIALQCSEADAHLILSEDNSAARLLSRPGEAIYNDANGMIEGNHFFQVVWLPDDRREVFLNRVRALERSSGDGRHRSQVVFEGNLPADPTRNPLLSAAIAAPEPAGAPKAPLAWVGDAVAIKDPTAAVFRRQSGANLLIIGQNDEAALGIATTAILGLSAQFPAINGETAAAIRFLILDGTPDDSSRSGYFTRATAGLPHPVQVARWRDAGSVVSDLADEVERRQAERLFDEPPVFLLIHDLSRFRDLRKGDDDFGFGGFSRGGEDRPSPAKQFTTLLREGPGVGVHVIAWCDGLNNLNRTLDRQSLREFEMRILFQMSPNDSSSLIDTPAASKLGFHRALFSSEEEGRQEKFRPYAPPSLEWTAEVARRLSTRSRAPTPTAGGTSA
jgi:S-DNA-T family DNA segregation ATPase FtsK/SpoIIIE